MLEALASGSCFSALLSCTCSLKLPRAYITQQCTRRVFYFFNKMYARKTDRYTNNHILNRKNGQSSKPIEVCSRGTNYLIIECNSFQCILSCICVLFDSILHTCRGVRRKVWISWFNSALSKIPHDLQAYRDWNEQLQSNLGKYLDIEERIFKLTYNIKLVASWYG